MISVKIIADSINVATGDRLVTFLWTYPRYIHAEVMTHRVFSRNAASSRAIPTTRFRDMVQQNPVIPSHWSANQAGMQADAELSPEAQVYVASLWTELRDISVRYHTVLTDEHGLHKQVANRILEPWFHIQVLVSATEWLNWFKLRCHPAAHPDIQQLADESLVHFMAHTPEEKQPDDWHLPYWSEALRGMTSEEQRLVCAARAARLSYANFDGQVDLLKDLELARRLRKSGHWSPFEHVAVAAHPHMRKPETGCSNFQGWTQYRKLCAGEDGQDIRLDDLVVQRRLADRITETAQLYRSASE